MKTRAAIAVVLLGACDVVLPDQVVFDDAVGSAYGLDPCDCRIEAGSIHLLCTSGGDLDTVSFSGIPLKVDQDSPVQLSLTVSDVRVGLVGEQPATVRIGSIGEPILSDPDSIFPIRQVSGMFISWPQQDACSFQGSGCEMGRLPIHSGRMESGHGGCQDPGF